ncbi:sigma factor-like helix-turn-helix DNA-binding protein [Actinomadura sp. NPDC000600]|uniref:RNA polymerase sigma factor n=1 Tax=Actinomadura sp. NPDC000600 TaxID=3154262 RepID=UPI0033973272
MDEQEARFISLYEAYYRNVFSYIVLRVAPQAAEDLTGEVFTIAWRKIGEVPEQALPWLLGVARNLARQSHGAAGQARGLIDRLAGLTTDADRYAWDAADHVIARDQALAALRTLSAKEAEAVTLTAWHGLEPPEAARVAGCSRTAFIVRLHRGRRRLARALDASHEPGTQAPGRAPHPQVIQEKP